MSEPKRILSGYILVQDILGLGEKNVSPAEAVVAGLIEAIRYAPLLETEGFTTRCHACHQNNNRDGVLRHKPECPIVYLARLDALTEKPNG